MERHIKDSKFVFVSHLG